MKNWENTFFMLKLLEIQYFWKKIAGPPQGPSNMELLTIMDFLQGKLLEMIRHVVGISKFLGVGKYPLRPNLR